ncbi:MAG: T9SS type A sorting domain-containing protein [Saprospiraceae bacterium]|nr:T9SS type A sorting domain-containing protein [Saprospiraceae bacterium]
MKSFIYQYSLIIRIIILGILLSKSHLLIAQNVAPCGIDYFENLLKNDKTVQKRRMELERITEAFRKSSGYGRSDSLKFIIPIVFHIMHLYGDENVSEDVIHAAVNRLNEDFQMLSAEVNEVSQPFRHLIGKGNIEFRLAKLDPEGNCTTGITKHVTKLTNGGDDALKYIVQWPPDRYLNVWVENSTPFGFAAYAYFPGAPEILDGIVILKNTLISNKIVLAHEVGHYLNLAHVWGFNNTTFLPENCSLSDLVDDTPPTTGSNFSCNLNQNICNPGVKENVENIMDYSSCRKMFTKGQVQRMHATLHAPISSRNNLWTEQNLALTGTYDGYEAIDCPPVADFTNVTFRICEGETITLKNVSYRKFTKSKWLIGTENGVTLETHDATFTFQTAGLYDVSLMVYSDEGFVDTLRREGLVEVASVETNHQPSIQDFETVIKIEDIWTLENEAGNSWEINQYAAFSGLQSLSVKRDNSNNGTSDIFYTGNFNFSLLDSPEFFFKLAYAGTPDSKDQLKIFISKDCGLTWQLKYSKTGASLITASSMDADFIPNISQWRTDFMNVSSLKNESSARFKFEYISDGQNNIYIDDIHFGKSTVSGTTEETEQYIRLFPNPSNGQATLQINMPLKTDVHYTIKDIHGKMISKDLILASEENADIVLSHPTQAGIYFIDMMINGALYVKKWVVIE